MVFLPSQLEYERQVASLKAANAAENDFSVSQAEVSSRQAMLENASDIKVKSRGGPLLDVVGRVDRPWDGCSRGFPAGEACRPGPTGRILTGSPPPSVPTP